MENKPRRYTPDGIAMADLTHSYSRDKEMYLDPVWLTIHARNPPLVGEEPPPEEAIPPPAKPPDNWATVFWDVAFGTTALSHFTRGVVVGLTLAYYFGD